jgi:drug/metabolite transporter (DMT)-like permease
MTKQTTSHIIPILQALLVTLLWSSSFVIIKIGLEEIPPLVFAGARYFIAFLVLLPFLFKSETAQEIKNLTGKEWIKLVALGIIFIMITQGAQFFGLSLLSSVAVSLMLNFTPIVVAVMSIFLIHEIPTGRQWFGTVLFICGILVYFFPVSFEGSEGLGLLVMGIGVLANAGAAVLGRDINRSRKLTPLTITGISMGVGSVLLLTLGIAIQGMPSVSLLNVLLLLWMAIINTAFAFTLWNLTLRSLSAMESSIINGTMLIQIAVLAWIFLGEEISLQEAAGMLIAGIGAVLVQLKKKK